MGNNEAMGRREVRDEEAQVSVDNSHCAIGELSSNHCLDLLVRLDVHSSSRLVEHENLAASKESALGDK